MSQIFGERTLNRRLSETLAILLLLLPINCFALGLGDIDLHSGLNQTLDADIELIAAESIHVDDIKVALASAEVFLKHGIDRPLFLTKIEFEVVQQDGKTLITLKSKDSIKEPFLDFLIEVNWPNGHLQREYTILLDPPILIEEAPAPMEQPVASVPEPAEAEVVPVEQQVMAEPETAPVSQTTAPPRQTPVPSQPRPQAAPASASVRDGSYGPVSRNETLWDIAQQLRPDDSVSIQQMMMALLRHNPEAFYDSNVNNLKAGYVLRIPDLDAITAMSKQEALRESRLQYERWMDSKQKRASQTDRRPQDSSASTQSIPTQDSGTGADARLRLVAPEGDDVSMAAGGSAGESQAGVGQRSMMDEESALVASQENAELRERIRAMEEQIASMQRLLTLKDDTLAVMQSRVGETGPEVTAMPEENEAQPAPAAGQMEPAETAAQPVAPAAPIPPPTAAIKQDKGLFEDPLVLGAIAGGVVVLFALLWLLRRRRSISAELQDDDLRMLDDEAALSPELADEQIAEEQGAEDTLSTDFTADSNMDSLLADEEEIDVLAEADVYMTYRRYDKAEELLKEAIQNEPGSQELQLKLLEVHYANGNTDEFVAQAENFNALLVGQEKGFMWDEVVKMGKQIAPDHALFNDDGGDEAASSEETVAESDQASDDEPADAAGDDSDLDLGDLDLGDTESAATSGDNSLEFEHGLASTEGDQAAEAATSELDLDEDFLEGLDLDEPSESDEALSLDDTQKEENLQADDDGLEDLSIGDEPVQDELTEVASSGEEGLTVAGDDLGDLTLDEEEASPEEDLAAIIDEEPAPVTDDAFAIKDEPQDKKKANENVASAALGGSDGDLDMDGDLDWLSDISDEMTKDLESLESMLSEDGDDEIGLSSDEDENSTKLDLAKAYIDMEDQESASKILNEVAQQGDDEQKRVAQELLQKIG